MTERDLQCSPPGSEVEAHAFVDDEVGPWFQSSGPCACGKYASSQDFDRRMGEDPGEHA